MPKIKKVHLRTFVIVFILLIVAGYCAVYLKSRTNTSAKSDHKPTSNEVVNLNPPTEQDKNEAEVHKKEISNSDSAQPATNGSVTPIITSYGQTNEKVEVAARVPGILEEGGTCTLILEKGTESRTGTSTGMANVSEVSCGFIAIPRSSLSPGEWTARVKYVSAKYNGISERKSVTIQ